MAAATHRASIENASEGLLWDCPAKGPSESDNRHRADEATLAGTRPVERSGSTDRGLAQSDANCLTPAAPPAQDRITKP